MSRVRSDKFTNRAATGPCTFTHGMHSSDTAGVGVGVTLGYGGIVAVGGTFGGTLIGVAASFSGAVTVGGTLTYEDVTNVDSTGIVTAKGGVRIPNDTGTITLGTSGDLQLSHDGSHSRIKDSGTGYLIINTDTGLLIKNGADDEGIAYFTPNGAVELMYDNSKKFETTTSGVKVTGNLELTGAMSGTLVEGFTSTTTAWSSTNDLNITNGNLHFTSGNLGGTNNTLDIYSTTGINTDLSVGQAINITGITSANATTAFVNAITIDGITNSVNWVGGTAPAAGGGSGFDTYTFNILKVGDATFHVIGNQVLTSAS